MDIIRLVMKYDVTLTQLGIYGEPDPLSNVGLGMRLLSGRLGEGMGSGDLGMSLMPNVM